MEIELLVEVDVALRRPPRADRQVWIRLSIEDGPNAGARAEELACQIAARIPGVEMPVAARILEWPED